MAAEGFAGNTVIIDLGLDRGEPDSYASPSRPTVPGWFSAALVAVLVLLSSAASAAPPPPALQPVLSLRVGPADSFTITEDAQLLAQSLGTLSAYDLGSGELRWQAEHTLPTYRLRTAVGMVLVRPWTYGPHQPTTTGIALADGEARWRHSGLIMTIPGSGTLLSVASVRSNSGTNRRVQGPIESLDPHTGDVRWSVPLPSTAVIVGVPGPDGTPSRMMVLHDDRSAVLHDLATGQVLARTEMPPAHVGGENPSVSGGVLLLRHLGRWAPLVSAYDPATLRLVWRRPAGRAYEVRPCGPLACLVGPDGVQAIQPSDGAPRWQRRGWRSVEERGGMLLAYGSVSSTAEPVGVIDPLTGRVLVDLSGWRLVGGDGGDHLLVTRAMKPGARTMVAVVEPDGVGPRPLAELPAGTGDCQAAANRLACRSTSGELIVWAYRKKV